MSRPRPGRRPSLQEPVVCHLVEGLNYGGAEILVHGLTTRMRGRGYAPIVCCLQHGSLTPKFEQDGIHVECLNLPRRSVLEGPLFFAFLLKAVRGLLHVVEKNRVTLIHAHLPDPIIWASVAGAVSRTPVVGTYHGPGMLPPDRAPLDPRNGLRRTLYRLAARLTDRTIAVSLPVRDRLCHDIGIDESKTIVLVNGIDTAAFALAKDDGRARAELGLLNHRVVTCVGRLAANKGQRFLIEAMSAVTRRHPDTVLLLVGDGPEMTALARLANELGLGSHVRFAGHRSDVPELLALTEIFVLPSFAEGIPLGLVEAMAAAKPVIATAVPGNADVVVDESHGMLVPPRDAGGLADAIVRLLDDPVASRAMGARAQARVREHFDIGRLVSATTSLYDQVLAERSARRRKAQAG